MRPLGRILIPSSTIIFNIMPGIVSQSKESNWLFYIVKPYAFISMMNSS